MTKPVDNNKFTVLIIDDPFRTFQCLPRLITLKAFSTLRVFNDHQGLEVLRKKSDGKWIIIAGLTSSNMGGGGFLHKARKIVPRAAILITGPLNAFLYHGGKFFKFSGANLERDINPILFSISQKMGIKHRHNLNNEPETMLKKRFGCIIGRSKSINSIYQMIKNLKKSSATVLIQGESGTGKELIAQTIYQTSSRKNRPFVAVNCGAIPVNLMESELFGHEKGAFTSAINSKKGKFEIADKGTLFLDEIGELSNDIQVKLLRVLQEKEFQRVGGNKIYKTDVRIIAATNKNLKEAMRTGHFREDLFYRLNVIPLHIPPLRERREDIPLLLDHFFEKIFRETDRPMPLLCQDTQKALLSYNYPGNVREMINIVVLLSITCPDREITLQYLPKEVSAEADLVSIPMNIIKELPNGGVRLEEVEKELIMKTLKKTSGNKQKAARVMGITRRLLYLRLSQYKNCEHNT